MTLSIKLTNDSTAPVAPLALVNGTLVLAKGEFHRAVFSAEKSLVVHPVQRGETAQTAEDRVLKRMFDAYSIQAGGKTHDGKPIPTWDEIGADVQARWRAALQAI